MSRLGRIVLSAALTSALMLAPIQPAFAETTAETLTANEEQQTETAASYKISFNANKGTKVKKKLTLSHLDIYGTLPKTTREGYKFKGWYTKKTGGVKVTAKSLFVEEADQTLYAHWKKLETEVQEEVSGEAQSEDTKEPAGEVTEQQELVASSAKLVPYTYTESNYQGNDYTGFSVLKNFKENYLFCQMDYNRFIGSNGKNGGCTATADAMLASIYTDQVFSPNDEGWIKGVGATWTNSDVLSGSKTFSVQQQCEAIYDSLQNGVPIMIRVVGHSVTAIGLRDGAVREELTAADILIADPADGKVKCADQMGYRVMTASNGWGLRIPKTSLKAAE